MKNIYKTRKEERGKWKRWMAKRTKNFVLFTVLSVDGRPKESAFLGVISIYQS